MEAFPSEAGESVRQERDGHCENVSRPLETPFESRQLESRPELPKHVMSYLLCVCCKRKAE